MRSEAVRACMYIHTPHLTKTVFREYPTSIMGTSQVMMNDILHSNDNFSTRFLTLYDLFLDRNIHQIHLHIGQR